MENKRIIYYDILKILACFAVIVNHNGGLMMQDDPGKYRIIFYLISFQLSKIGVPLFIMVTGGLLLGRNDNPKDLYLKRIPRILMILFLFTFLVFIKDNGLSYTLMTKFIRTIISEPIIIPYWYLYMLIGLLLVTPFLQRMIKGFTEIDYHYFLDSVSCWLELFPSCSIISKSTCPHT